MLPRLQCFGCSRGFTDAVQYPWAKGLLKRGDLWFNVQDETKIKYDGEFENGSVSHKTRPVLKAGEY